MNDATLPQLILYALALAWCTLVIPASLCATITVVLLLRRHRKPKDP